MGALDEFLRLFEFDDWANREVLDSLKLIDSPPARSVKFMAHIVSAERLWLGRLRKDKKPVVVWPELSLEECEAQIIDLRSQWQGYLDSLTAAELSGAVAYVNTKGEPWTNRVQDILMHVAMHSVYHRGQIATDLREAGHVPPYTDFIHCIRQGFVG